MVTQDEQINRISEKYKKLLAQKDAKIKKLSDALDKRIDGMFVSLDTARNKALQDLKEKIKEWQSNHKPANDDLNWVLELIEKEIR